MPECASCFDDAVSDTDVVTTTCCSKSVCRGCIGSGGVGAVLKETGAGYSCVYCSRDLKPDSFTGTDVEPGDMQPRSYTLLSSGDRDKVRNAVEAAYRRVDIAVPLGQMQTNAWQHGAYTHSPGCGEVVQMFSGCDTLKCPNKDCKRTINVMGGELNSHAGYCESFFNKIRKFSANSPAGAHEALRTGDDGRVWESRFLTDLVAGVADGSLAGWPAAMDREVWGGFPDYLLARVAPRAPGGPDGSSLFALLASIGHDQGDGALVNSHYHDVERPVQERQPTALAPLQVNGARRALLSKLGPEVAGILRKKLADDGWWRS